MDKYRIRLNERAFRDLEAIFSYIANDLQAPQTAKKQTERIRMAMKKLDTFPQSHQERDVGRYAGKGYRQLVIDNYIAIFRIDEEHRTVHIITIQYQGRDI